MVDRVIKKIGYDINIATPLGLGKPVKLLNEFYRCARKNPKLDLTIVTALSLLRPDAGSGLEKRLIEPLNERIFGNYPRIEYAYDQQHNTLPENVTVHEFYVKPGSILNSPQGQQDYISTNYTHAARDILDQDINVIAQLITPARSIENYKEPVHSLSCNPDLTLDALDLLKERKTPDDEFILIGETNENLPFMYEDTLLGQSRFDYTLELKPDYQLFGPPSESINATDYAIGFHASRLIADGGTLQIGIGSLSEALSRMLILRHKNNDTYNKLTNYFNYPSPSIKSLVNEIGGSERFTEGLFASTEMLVRGFEELYREGLLSREVFDNYVIQQFVNENDGDTTVKLKLLDKLVQANEINERLTEDCLDFLHHYGIFKETVRLKDGQLVLSENKRVDPDLSDEETREFIQKYALGDFLKEGDVIQAGFFLGPPSMYDFLRQLKPAERRRLRMTRISYVNNLYGDEKLKRAQRKKSRFLNSAMKVTLTGAVVSDGLEDMRVLSGVGGQYNFVAMAQELENGRSIIMLPSTRESDGKTETNIVWNYGHTTIPRHLRDIVITEYGIADLRGKSDRKIIESMLSITDARFQNDLVKQAKSSGKLPQDWTLPEKYRQNTPDKINNWMTQASEIASLPKFPFGSELTDEEVKIGRALRKFNSHYQSMNFSWSDILTMMKGAISYDESKQGLLSRMDLKTTETWKEYLYQKILLASLALSN